MRVVAMVQARMGSTRLRGKMVMPINGEPLISHVLRSASRMKVTDLALLAPRYPEDDVLEDWGCHFGFEVVRGHREPYFRFAEAIEKLKVKDDDYIVRICGGSPGHYPDLADFLIDDTIKHRASYGTYVTPEGVPAMQTRLGGFVEVFQVGFFNEQRVTSEVEEHVTYGMYANGPVEGPSGITKHNIHCRVMPSDLLEYGAALTIDTYPEAVRVDKIIKVVGFTPGHYRDVILALRKNPTLRVHREYLFKEYDGWTYSS